MRQVNVEKKQYGWKILGDKMDDSFMEDDVILKQKNKHNEWLLEVYF